MTHTIRFLAVSGLAVSGMMTALVELAPPARADAEVERAQTQLSNAYVDFYNQVKANPTMSRGQMNDLYHQKADGPNREVGSAIQHAFKTFEKQNRILENAPPPKKREQDPASKPDPNTKPPKKEFKFADLFPKYGGKAGKDSPARASVRADDPAPSKPDLVLDGKNIPKEIEFPGKRPAAAGEGKVSPSQ